MCDDTVRMRCCIHDGIIVPGAPFNVMLIPWFFHSSTQQTFCAVYFLLTDRSNPRGLYLNPNSCSHLALYCSSFGKRDTQVHLARLLSHTLLLLRNCQNSVVKITALVRMLTYYPRRLSTIPHAIRCRPPPTPATLLTAGSSESLGTTGQTALAESYLPLRLLCRPSALASWGCSRLTILRTLTAYKVEVTEHTLSACSRSSRDFR